MEFVVLVACGVGVIVVAAVVVFIIIGDKSFKGDAALLDHKLSVISAEIAKFGGQEENRPAIFDEHFDRVRASYKNALDSRAKNDVYVADEIADAAIHELNMLRRLCDKNSVDIVIQPQLPAKTKRRI